MGGYVPGFHYPRVGFSDRLQTPGFRHLPSYLGAPAKLRQPPLRVARGYVMDEEEYEDGFKVSESIVPGSSSLAHCPASQFFDPGRMIFLFGGKIVDDANFAPSLPIPARA